MGRPTKSQASLTQQGFMRKNPARDNARAKVARHFEAALEVLAEIAHDPREKSSERIKAAATIVQHHVSLLKEENADNLRRLELQMKLDGHLNDALSFDASEDDDMPILQFDTIQEVV